jgi:hypothetical protein
MFVKIFLIYRAASQQLLFSAKTEKISFLSTFMILKVSVADQDPSDPYVFGPPGSGSISHIYGSGSGSSYQQAKIVRKTLDFLLAS